MTPSDLKDGFDQDLEMHDARDCGFAIHAIRVMAKERYGPVAEDVGRTLDDLEGRLIELDLLYRKVKREMLKPGNAWKRLEARRAASGHDCDGSAADDGDEWKRH